MSHIVLTEDQARVLLQSRGRIEVRDEQGYLLGWIRPPSTLEEVEEAKRLTAAAKGRPCYSAEEVHRHLKGLEDAWEREGPFDRARMRELLQQMRAEKQP